MTSPSVPVPVEPVPGEPVRDKIVTAAEAVRLIRDGDAVVVGGFLGSCFPEELVLALQRRFLDGATPRDLAVVFTVAGGRCEGQRARQPGPSRTGAARDRRSLGRCPRVAEAGGGR